MSEPEVFPNAPITEAVLDIRVRPHPSVDLKKLEAIHDKIRDGYPEKEGITNWLAGFQLEAGAASTQTSAKPIGFLFRSGDRTKVVQAAQPGFTFNKLKPYENWMAFRSEARRLWREYVGLAQPLAATRVALRFINRIELPLPFSDFKEYIRTVPEVAPGVNQALAQFLMQLEIPYPDIPARAIITLNIDLTEPITNTVPIIFDVDVFEENEYEPSSEEIWSKLDELRRLKNDIFFSSLTDRAKELFR